MKPNNNDSIDPQSLTPEDVERTEIISTLGNALIIQDGEQQRPVPLRPEYRLLYEHHLFDLIQGGSGSDPLVLQHNDPYIAISPTNNERVFILWVGDDRPIQNPPSDTTELLQGVLDILDGNGSVRLTELHKDIKSRQVRVSVVDDVLAQYGFVSDMLPPPSTVVPTDEGWVIEGIFLLKWDASVYLRTRDFTSQSYRIGGGISETSEEPQFISLQPDFPEEFESVTLPLYTDDEDEPEEITLTEIEQIFLTKASWLVDYRNNYDDDIFWHQIEEHVRHQMHQQAKKNNDE